MTAFFKTGAFAVAAVAWFSNPVVADNRVTAQPLKDFLMYPSGSAPATVVSLNDAKISAQISARIISLPVRVGDRVKKGDKLVQLDCRDNRLIRESALARKSLAQKDAKRARSLKQTSNIAEQTYNQAVTEEIQASIAVKQAALQLERCTVTAPFTGVITARLASEGELADPGTPLLTMQDTENLEVSAQAPQQLTDVITALDDLKFSYAKKQYPVELRTLASHINPSSGNQEIRLTFVNDKALPGSTGRLNWRLTQPHIPSELLIQRNGDVGVFLAREGIAVFKKLDDAQIGHPAATGLAESSLTILQGRFGLTQGDAVEVIEE